MTSEPQFLVVQPCGHPFPRMAKRDVPYSASIWLVLAGATEQIVKEPISQSEAS